jgi:hypothetical protein
VPSDFEFGHWTTLEERLAELRDRLVAWAITTETGFDEVWEQACEIYKRKLENLPFVIDTTTCQMTVPPIFFIEAFEEALTLNDTIWVNTAGLEDLGFDDN